MATTKWTLLLVLLLTILLGSTIPLVHSREIVATNEWQLVKEGDTIPSGLHVRMDLEKGEKWVKLISDDDDDDSNQYANNANDCSLKDGVCMNDDNDEHGKDAYSLAAVAVQEEEKTDVVAEKGKDSKKDNDNDDGSGIQLTHLSNPKLSAEANAKITSQMLAQHKNKLESIAALNDFENEDTNDDEDVDMMYRALQSLPDEEKTRMGGLPSQPDSPRFTTTTDASTTTDTLTPEWEEFEQQVKTIWSQRQADLKRFEEEHIANIPDVMGEHIEFIKMYLASPLQHILSIAEKTKGNPNDDSEGIIWVLSDLEFLLIDIDMARDFHTLGGWPLLASLTTDSTHGLPSPLQHSNNEENVEIQNSTMTNNSKDYDFDTLQKIVWMVQRYAALGIGNSVKNVEEFHSWALEDFSDVLLLPPSTTTNGQDRYNTTEATNLLSIMLSKMNTLQYQSLPWQDAHFVKKISSDLYALGALLRGNRMAIHYFTSLEGQMKSIQLLNSIMEHLHHAPKIELYTERLLYRIMRLVEDIITDIKLHPSTGTGEDKELDLLTLSAFTTNEWCRTPLRVMTQPFSNLKYDMVTTMDIMSPYCKYSGDDLAKAQEELGLGSSFDPEEMVEFTNVIKRLQEKVAGN